MDQQSLTSAEPHLARFVPSAVDAQSAPAIAPAVVCHDARRRTMTHHAAKGSGCAQAAAHVRPCRQGHHASCKRDRRAARGPGTGQDWIERIYRRAIDAVHSIGSGPEFRRVALREHDAAGSLHALDDEVIVTRYSVLLGEGAPRRAQACSCAQVLDRNRQTVQRAEFPRRLRTAASARLASSRAGPEFMRHQGVQLGVDLLIFRWIEASTSSAGESSPLATRFANSRAVNSSMLIHSGLCEAPRQSRSSSALPIKAESVVCSA